MLAVEGLVRTYGEVRALDDMTFAVPPGSVTGFLGPNGAGKTTTMRAIFGLTALDRGTVTMDVKPVDRSTRRRFGYLPEERGLYPTMRVLEQLCYLGELRGMPRAEVREEAERWLVELGLSEGARDALEDLSLGNQQRVQLIGALIHRPDVLVLDEPFSGLDPVAFPIMLPLLFGYIVSFSAVDGANTLVWILAFIPLTSVVAARIYERSVLQSRKLSWRQAFRSPREIAEEHVGAPGGWQVRGVAAASVDS